MEITAKIREETKLFKNEVKIMPRVRVESIQQEQIEIETKVHELN